MMVGPQYHLPFPPPPPLQPTCPTDFSLHPLFNHLMQAKDSKQLSLSQNQAKVKKLPLIPSHLDDSSQSVTSHAQQINEHSRAFSEVHPEASNQPQSEKANSTNKATKVASSEKKQTASHSKYGF
jgi:hypothetical protein